MDEEKTYYFLAMKEHCNIFGNCNATPYREMNDKYNFISFIWWACHLHDEKMLQNSHNHTQNMHVLLRTISVIRMIWCKYFGWSTLFFSVTHQDSIVWCHYYHSIGLVFGVLTFVVRFHLIPIWRHPLNAVAIFIISSFQLQTLLPPPPPPLLLNANVINGFTKSSPRRMIHVD